MANKYILDRPLVDQYVMITAPDGKNVIHMGSDTFDKAEEMISGESKGIWHFWNDGGKGINQVNRTKWLYNDGKNVREIAEPFQVVKIKYPLFRRKWKSEEVYTPNPWEPPKDKHSLVKFVKNREDGLYGVLDDSGELVFSVSTEGTFKTMCRQVLQGGGPK